MNLFLLLYFVPNKSHSNLDHKGSSLLQAIVLNTKVMLIIDEQRLFENFDCSEKWILPKSGMTENQAISDRTAPRARPRCHHKCSCPCFRKNDRNVTTNKTYLKYGQNCLEWYMMIQFRFGFVLVDISVDMKYTHPEARPSAAFKGV